MRKGNTEQGSETVPAYLFRRLKKSAGLRRGLGDEARRDVQATVRILDCTEVNS